ncbi:MAG: LysR family transcriptional regulator [Rhodospirillaceae bacterium]|nr:MAG: LysR family transcriptional regulator [Rhodospirillaceae bacterium]
MGILTGMETFTAVVKAGSFTKAAERLGISKSFVSKQVSQLENTLGTRLLHRSTRKLSLTDEGEQFYNHCNLIVSEAEKAKAEIVDGRQNPRGRIRITVPQSLIISNAGKVLLNFQDIYPEIEIEIIASGASKDIIDDGIDLALRIGQIEDSTLICRKLSECVFQTVASPQYVRQYGKPETPIDLTHHNCLIYASSKLSSNWPFRLPNGKEIKVNARGKLSCNDGHLILKAALEGKGIAFAPSILFQPYIDEGKLTLLLPEYAQPPVSISALYPSNRNLPRRVRVLIDYLSEHLPLSF